MYKGNPLLRSAGDKISYTPEMMSEYIKCKEDIIYFAEKYFTIISIDYGKMLIPLYDFQKKVLKALVEPQMYKGEIKSHSCILASRQVGKSTLARILLLHEILFNKDKTYAILANKEKTALKLLKELKDAYINLPMWLQQGVIDGGWNKQTIEFENGIRVISSSTASSAVRSETISILFLDEFAFVPDNIASDFMKSVYPTISSGKTSRIIVVSCVTEDTMVFTNNGIKEISDFVDKSKVGAYEVDEYSVMGKTKVNNGNIIVNNDTSDTRIIQTANSEIECSLNHKLYACKNGVYGWYKSNELTESDYISVKYGMDLWGDNDSISFIPSKTNKNRNEYDFGNKITKDMAYFCGIFIAEGYARKIKNRSTNNWTGGQVTLTCGDDVSHAFNNIGVKFNSYDKLHYTANSKVLLEFLLYLGFDIDKKSKKKIIPKRLLSMSKENMMYLIKGLFDGDGSSSVDGGVVGYSSTSKKLIKQIRMILLNFGILTEIRKNITKPSKLVHSSSIVYYLSLAKNSSRLFYDIIGFNIKRKQDKERYLTSKFTRNSHNIIPFSKQHLMDIKNINRDDYLRISKTRILVGNYKKNLHFSRDFLLKNKDVLLSLDIKEINKIYENVDENIKWLPIKNISESKNKVYDFSLNNIDGDDWCHSVLYNGIVGHQTPNGLNHYYDIWKSAVDGENNYYPIKINWWEVPGRDEEFKRKTIADLPDGIQGWNQEYGNVFLGGSSTLIDSDILEQTKTSDPSSLKWSGAFQIWEEPIPNVSYVLGIDTAKGVGKDSSVLQVLKITDDRHIEQVATYSNNQISTYDYSDVCLSIAEWYNNAYMMIESNDVGGEVLTTLWYDHEYENICNCDKKGLGIRSTRSSKLHANLLLKEYMDKGWLKINNKKTIYELSRYIEVKPNVFKGETQTTHDDEVTSLIWAVWFLRTVFYAGDITNRTIDEQYNLSLKKEDDNTPIAFMDGDDSDEDFDSTFGALF